MSDFPAMAVIRNEFLAGLSSGLRALWQPPFWIRTVSEVVVPWLPVLADLHRFLPTCGPGPFPDNRVLCEKRRGDPPNTRDLPSDLWTLRFDRPWQHSWPAPVWRTEAGYCTHHVCGLLNARRALWNTARKYVARLEDSAMSNPLYAQLQKIFPNELPQEFVRRGAAVSFDNCGTECA